jgi:hypothetical protein
MQCEILLEIEKNYDRGGGVVNGDFCEITKWLPFANFVRNEIPVKTTVSCNESSI